MNFYQKSVLVLACLLGLSACTPKSIEEGPLTKSLERKVGNTVYFDFDSSLISPEAHQTLTEQAQFIKSQAPNKTIIIEGYCDERGTREYNLALGERRANAALRVLIDSGINPEHMVVISYGKEKPAVIGDTEAAWAKNRRAVTVIN